MVYMHFCKHTNHTSSITFQKLIRIKFYCNNIKQKWNTTYTSSNQWHSQVYSYCGFAYLQNTLVSQCRCLAHLQLFLHRCMAQYTSSCISPPVSQLLSWVLYSMECAFHWLFTISWTKCYPHIFITSEKCKAHAEKKLKDKIRENWCLC